MLKRIGLFFLLLATIGLPLTAQAACTVGAGSLPLILQFSPWSPANFDPLVANGTVVASQTLAFSSVAGSGATVTCPGGFGVQTRVGTTGAREATYQTYPTGIAGVGIRFATQAVGVWPTTEDLGTAVTTRTLTTTGSVLVEFVKIGPITAGGTIVGELGASYLQSGATKLSSYVVNGGITLKPTVPTCTVQTPHIQVPMGSAAASAFTGVGSTSSSSGVPFNIQLQCAGGTSGAVTNMYMTLTDQTNPANVSNVLSLTAASNATGVGIQVRNGNTIVAYGRDSSAVGNMNQWFVTQSGNGPVNIPLTARYVQTGFSVRPGSANGIATFTMSYQ